MKDTTFWEKIRFKFRVSILNENTLGEVWHFRLSRIGMIVVLTAAFLLTFAIFAVLILFTPVKSYLPGYNGNIRQELIEEMVRLDSLTERMALQTQYVEVIKSVVSGEVLTDSIQPIDSLAILQRERLLEERDEAIKEFMNQYEEKERDNLTMFNVSTTTPIYTLFRPVHGVIEQSFSAEDGRLHIAIRTPLNENVTSVLAGTVVYTSRTLEHDWVMMVQHEGDYLSVYKNQKRLLRRQGDRVQAGETLGIADDDKPLLFEIWQKGIALNPEDLITF